MQGQVKARQQIDVKDKWDLSPMYADVRLWEKDFEELVSQQKTLSEFKGKLAEQDVILDCLTLLSVCSRKLEKVYVWANLKNAEDLSVQEFDLCAKKVEKLCADFAEVTAFIDPELVALDESLINQMLVDPRFANFSMQLKKIVRAKKHVLSEPEERLLAKASLLWGVPAAVFGSFDNVDAQFDSVKNKEGKELTLSHGTYGSLLESRDRDVRKQTFEAMHKEYKEHIYTLSEVLAGQIKQHNYLADVRNHKSALAYALHGNAIGVDVYENLLKQVHNNLDGLHGYVAKRGEILGVKEMQMWDLRVQLNAAKFKFTFDEAIDLVLAASKPLGDDYVAVLEKGLKGGWVDRYENKGKRSGGFSSGCYDSWPYILMNFNGTLGEVFTLMHEAGHSMHTYLANQNQPHELANYPIFTAEIASTVNERLLAAYLLDIWDGEKQTAVRHYEIDSIRATLFRQAMFAEFELLIHETQAAGSPLTKDFLCEEYAKLNQIYYGAAMAKDDFVQYEWARIPHFYYNFYVYQYATGIAAAYNFAEKILAGDTVKYLNLLKSGGKDFPLTLLKEAGVDMTADFYKPVFSKFKDLVAGI